MSTRRFYVQTIDERTGEPAFMGVVEADSLADAAQEGQRQGAMGAGHPQVRPTHVVEQETGAAAAVARNLTLTLVLSGGRAA